MYVNGQQDKSTRETPVKFLHLLDHYGTISNLIFPLARFPEHRILTSFDSSLESAVNIIEGLVNKYNPALILHSTGNRKPFYSIKEKLFKMSNHPYIFLHVSPKHFMLKNREIELQSIKEISESSECGVLTPSSTVGQEFRSQGIDAKPIQVGIDFDEFPCKSSKNKHITTICTSEEPIYQYIKGIDLFAEVMDDLKLKDQCMIFGMNSNQYGIKSLKVSNTEFIKCMSESKVYVQFSRTESYNISAIIAKRLKIPCIVSDIEGHRDNLRFGLRMKSKEDLKNCLEDLLYGAKSCKFNEIIEKNYEDSLTRESLSNFRYGFEQLLEEGGLE